MSLRVFINSLKRGELLLPILRSYLTKVAKAEDLGTQSHKDTVVRDAQQTIDCFKARQTEYNHRERLEGDYFHPSQIGGCMRAMFFAEMNAPTDGSKTGADYLHDHLIFEVGTYFHVLFQNLCERAGVLLSREVAIQDKANRLLGHADGIVRISGIKYLLEIKTISERGFSGLNEVKEAHKQQTHAYMKSLNLPGAIVVYYNKGNSDTKEFFVAYSQTYYARKVAPRIDKYFACKQAKQLPPKEGTSPYGMPCGYCAFRKLCFDNKATERWMKISCKSNPVLKKSSPCPQPMCSIGHSPVSGVPRIPTRFVFLKT